MAVSLNLNQALDKAYENSTVDDILKAPPSALAGLGEKHDELFKFKALDIKTVRDLGRVSLISACDCGIVGSCLVLLFSQTRNGPGLSR